MPDLVVLPDTLSTGEQVAVQALYREAPALERAIFNEGVRYVQEHPGLSRDFQLTDTDMDAFFRVLQEDGLDATPRQIQQADRYLRHRLTREIALQAWGEEGEFLKVQDSDPQLQKARDVLAGASSPAELFQVAGADGPAPPDAAPFGGPGDGER